jgi:hypothetical protein
MIILTIGYTDKGHLSLVLKEEVKEPKVIERKSVPGLLSVQPGLHWGHPEPAAGIEVGRLEKGLPVYDYGHRVVLWVS